MFDIQKLPDAGILIRFRTARVVLDEDVSESRNEIEQLLAPERLILIDLSNVEQFSSSAIAMLVGMQRRLRELAGNLKLCGLRGGIEDVFRVCRLDQVFDIYPDLESALGDRTAESL